MSPEDATVRGLALLAAVLLIALIGIFGIIALGMIAGGFRRYWKARNKPTRSIDAWSAAGQRAEPAKDEDEGPPR